MSASFRSASGASPRRTAPHGASPRRLARVARRAMLLGVLLAAASAAPSVAAAACVGSDLQPAAVSAPAYSQTTLCLINAQRGLRGLRVLADNRTLDGVATAYARRMVAGSFFAHVAPDGADLADRLSEAGYMSARDDWVVGENLAWGTGTLSTPNAVVAAWMASAGHRANILRADYCEIGIGVMPRIPSDRSAGVTVTTDFGAVDAGTARARPISRAARRRAAARAATRPLATWRAAIAGTRPAAHCRP